jgi:hypothetical protein
MKNYGTATVGEGGLKKDLDILSFVRVTAKDHRLISVMEIAEDETMPESRSGGLIISVENPESSGRNTQNKMWLSVESVVAVLSAVNIYFSAKGIDIADLMKPAHGEKVAFELSDNLQNPFPLKKL